MPALDGAPHEPRHARALFELLEANDEYRIRYHAWLKADRPARGPVASALREAEERVAKARESVPTNGS